MFAFSQEGPRLGLPPVGQYSNLLELVITVTRFIRLPISIRNTRQVFAQILEREAFWLVPFFDEPISWRIIPPKNDNELRATQAPRLKLGNAPNEFKGYLSNQHLQWNMPQQQGQREC